MNFSDKELPNAKKLLCNAQNMSNRISLPLGYGCIFTAAVFILKPVFNDIISNYFFGMEFSYELPFVAAYFYDPAKSPQYEFTYFIQTYEVIVIATFVVSS